MKTGNFYKLTEDNGGFKKDTVVLLGDIETMEFFDITTELSSGESYSSYSIDISKLKEFDYEKQKELRSIFNNFVNNNYKLNKDILLY